MEHLFLIIVALLFAGNCDAQLGRCKANDVSLRTVTPPVVHGEGPHWDSRRQVLYYVDISNQTVNLYNPADQSVSSVFIEGGPVSPVIPTRDGKFIIGRGRDVVNFSWDGKSKRGPLRVLVTVDKDKPRNRFNDGKADASGRMWIGTMGPEDPKLELNQASFYSFPAMNRFKPIKHLSGVSVSNGLGWNKNDTLMYYIDSPTRNVDVFDFDLQRGNIKNRRTVFSLDKFGIEGFPDGMAIDSEDHLWVAVFQGGVVLHIDPTKGELLRTIKFPVKLVTSCAFGGPGLSTLYVTTSKRGLTPDQIRVQPEAGSVFTVEGHGAKGQRKTNTAKVHLDLLNRALLPDSDSEDELPPAWEERATLDGSVYYVNHVTKASQWTHPRTGKKKVVSGDLPQGWAKQVDQEGGVLYIDHGTGRTTHSDPRLAFAKELKDHDMDLRQRFDGSSTALQVLLGCDLSGKTALVTGATNGIGFETARCLALHGAEVIISGRSTGTCQFAEDRIHAEKSTTRTSIQPMDLTSLASVRAGASQLRQRYQKIDILILNAAVMGVGWQLTEDGFETLFQVNYLAQFYLLLLLESCLHRGARVIVVASESHRFSSITPANLSIEKLSPKSPSGYWDIMAYNHSKLCNVLHVLELSRRLAPRGVDVMALHPGNMIYTGIAQRSCFYRLLFSLVRPFTKSLQQGAATTVYCAVAPELAGCTGTYFNNCWLAKASDNGQNLELAHALWDLTVDILKQQRVPMPSSIDSAFSI